MKTKKWLYLSKILCVVLSLLFLSSTVSISGIFAVGEENISSEEEQTEDIGDILSEEEQTENSGDILSEEEQAPIDIYDSATYSYDPQPATAQEVQAAIDAYNAAYSAAMMSGGFLEAVAVAKPHWQYEVAAELMPANYHCERVYWDEDFGAEYFTFFSNPMAVGYGEGNFVNKPPGGPDIDTVFRDPVGHSKIDGECANVAIITFDKKDQFGGIWTKEKLDLSLPFNTKMVLHLGHSENPADSRAVADGMTFAMHNHEKALGEMIGGKGEGLGVYRGRNTDGSYLPNSLVIEFDTFRNYDNNSTTADPTSSGYSSHCSLIIPTRNGRSGMAPYSGAFPNVADHRMFTSNIFFNPSRNWIEFEVTWLPEYTDTTLGGTLTYVFAGQERSYTISDVTSIFKGTEVWWGFTGATGGQTAVQAAAIAKLPEQEYDVVKTVESNLREDIDGGIANAGDTLGYTIRVESPAEFSAIGIEPITISDLLSEYLDYSSISDITVVTGTSSDATGTSDTIPAEQIDIEDSTLILETGITLGDVGDWLEVSFTIKIKNDTEIGTIICNTATVTSDGLGPKDSNTTKVRIVETSKKTVADSSPAGVGGSEVTIGSEITYEIKYVNNTEDTADLTIEDVLPEGVEYQGHTDTDNATHTGDGGDYTESSHMLIWNIGGVPYGESGIVTVTVKVTPEIDLDEIDNNLVNMAELNWSTAPDAPENIYTENPVVVYAVSGTVSGLPVNENLTITYTIDNGTPQTVTTDANGDYTISRVPYDAKVVITPPAAPTHYRVTPPSITLDSVTAASTGNDFTYVRIAGAITIEKYGDQSGATPLTGGEFTIERWDSDMNRWIYIEYDSAAHTWSDTASGGTHYTQTTAGTEGTTTFDDLPLDRYRIQEVTPPTGYAALKEPIVTDVPYTIDDTDPYYDTVTAGRIPDETTTDSGVTTAYYYNMTYTIIDTAAINLPTAGGGISPVMLVLAGVGIALLAAAGYIFYRRRGAVD